MPDDPKEKRSEVPAPGPGSPVVSWTPLAKPPGIDRELVQARDAALSVQPGEAVFGLSPDYTPLVVSEEIPASDIEAAIEGKLERVRAGNILILRRAAEGDTLDTCLDFGGITGNGTVIMDGTAQAPASKGFVELVCSEVIKSNEPTPIEKIKAVDLAVSEMAADPQHVERIRAEISGSNYPALLETSMLDQIDEGRVGVGTILVAEESSENELSISQLGDGGWFLINSESVLAHGGYFKPGVPPSLAFNTQTVLEAEIITTTVPFPPGSSVFTFTDSLLKGPFKTVEELANRALELRQRGMSDEQIARALLEIAGWSDDALVTAMAA